MNIIKAIIIISLLSNTVDSRYHHKFMRNYISNIQKNIYYRCNNEALKKTNNIDVYNCFINKNNSCHLINNYNDFNLIKKECVKNYINDFNMGILISIILWVIIIMYGTTRNTNNRYS
jgi:hypothetical protein